MIFRSLVSPSKISNAFSEFIGYDSFLSFKKGMSVINYEEGADILKNISIFLQKDKKQILDEDKLNKICGVYLCFYLRSTNKKLGGQCILSIKINNDVKTKNIFDFDVELTTNIHSVGFGYLSGENLFLLFNDLRDERITNKPTRNTPEQLVFNLGKSLLSSEKHLHTIIGLFSGIGRNGNKPYARDFYCVYEASLKFESLQNIVSYHSKYKPYFDAAFSKADDYFNKINLRFLEIEDGFLDIPIAEV